MVPQHEIDAATTCNASTTTYYGEGGEWTWPFQSPLFVSAHHARSSANGDGHNVHSTPYPIPSPELKDKNNAGGCWCYHGLTTSSYVLASEAGFICSCHSFIHLEQIHIANKHKVLVMRVGLESRKPLSRFSSVDIFTVGGAGAKAEAWTRIIKPSGLPCISFFPRQQQHHSSPACCRSMSGRKLSGPSQFLKRQETLAYSIAGWNLAVLLLSSRTRSECGYWMISLVNYGATEISLFRPPPPLLFKVILSQMGSTALYFYQLENSTVRTIELPDGIDRPCDLAAFYHAENVLLFQ